MNTGAERPGKVSIEYCHRLDTATVHYGKLSDCARRTPVDKGEVVLDKP